MNKIVFKLIWFDSLGAKSSCTLVKTPDTSILIDPGVAIMHPGFPASRSQKLKWMNEGYDAVKRAARRSKIIVISHYHYDHFTDFDEEIYRGKLVLAKNPNEYVNDSQRKRAEEFYDTYVRVFGGEKLEDLLLPPREKSYPNPEKSLRIALSRDYGDYWERKRELLEKGRKWFLKRAEKWGEYERIPELEFGENRVEFADGRRYRMGKTVINFTEPLFHGIEYARVGWVIATTITYGKEKLIHTSDLEGPVIEDQAEWIIRENPDILIVDGPSTYLIPYMLNLINLGRAVENMCRIIEETDTELIIYDHHLPREPRYRERVRRVYEVAEREGKRVLTAAEYLGEVPAVLRTKR